MRIVTGFCLLLAFTCAFSADRKDSGKTAPPRPATGIRTPGVQIPFASLKSELDYDLPAPASWIGATDVLWIPARDSLLRVDPKAKESKFGEPLAGLNKPCAGLTSAFNSLWIPNCGSSAIARADVKGGKIAATLPIGAVAERVAIAANPDSVWAITDAHGTLSRIDPATNSVVAEIRAFADCDTLVFGETALWLTCPAENKLVRVDPETNLISKVIDVSEHPVALALGENSVWVLCAKEGKIDRVDPKTNKVTRTIELGAPATGGSIAFGEGNVWVSLPAFPLTRIDPASEKVAQQFFGEGAGVIQAALGSLWLADSHAGKLRKFDPKRIAATLAE